MQKRKGLAALVLLAALLAGLWQGKRFLAQAAWQPDVDTVQGGSAVNGNVVSGSTVSGGIVSGGTVSGNAVSGNAVSGDAVSGSAVTGGAVSGQTVTGCEIPKKKANSRIVSTKYGMIKGKKTKKAYIWLGVPYGETERWQAPNPPQPWAKTHSCLKKKVGKGDDCLFLNIYKPVKSEKEQLPVMVFLHGGGNVGGTANRNFSTFVEDTEVIAVSVEFRQGAFGWFQNRGLQGKDRLANSGNFAMLDIKLALEWVRDNISEFGGNAENVTLSGFSAGARDTLNCVISPVMQGLFHKAVSFSGGMTTCSIKQGRVWSNKRVARVLVRRGRFSNFKRALRYVRNLSKKKLRKLLMGLTDREISNMAGSTALRLTNFPQCFRDGRVIPKDGFDCLEYGGYNRMPIMIGSNNSEFANMSYRTMQRILLKNPKTFRNRKHFLRLLKKAKEYGSKLQSSFYLEKFAVKLAADPYHSDIYAYRFKWGEDKKVVGSNYATYLGAVHGMDVDFLLEKYKKGEANVNTSIYKSSNLKGRKALSALMRRYIKNFLYTGDPNGVDGMNAGLTKWNKWRNVPGAGRIMNFSASKKKAKAGMTSKYINRTKLKRKMRRSLSKKAYRFLKTRILNDRFFM